jgi:hypothetical protein
MPEKSAENRLCDFLTCGISASAACTVGSATTTAHMPTPPRVEISVFAPRRSQARTESVVSISAD